MKQALEDLEISTRNFPPGQVLGAISQAKNELVGPEDYAADATDFYGRKVAEAYLKYQEILERSSALDFDDLLVKTVHMLRSQPTVLAQLRERFQYVLVDEYQDTNHAQFLLAQALAGTGREPGRAPAPVGDAAVVDGTPGAGDALGAEGDTASHSPMPATDYGREPPAD